MTELLQYIDDQIAESCIDDIQSYGLCHLVEDDNSVYPSTFEEKAQKVSPDDKFAITIYHRLLDGSLENKEDLSFGRSITAVNNQRIRTVIFIKMDEGHSKIDDIINQLPDNFEVEGYQFANVSKSITLNRNQNTIWAEEFGESYKDKMIKKFLIYALEYDLQYIKCDVCV